MDRGAWWATVHGARHDEWLMQQHNTHMRSRTAPQVSGFPKSKVGDAIYWSGEDCAKDRFLLVVALVEIKSLVSNLGSESTFTAYPVAVINWLYRMHTEVWRVPDLHFRPPGFPRCRWLLPQVSSLLVYSTAAWPMWPQLERVLVPRASEECFLTCSTPPLGYTRWRETDPVRHI